MRVECMTCAVRHPWITRTHFPSLLSTEEKRGKIRRVVGLSRENPRDEDFKSSLPVIVRDSRMI